MPSSVIFAGEIDEETLTVPVAEPYSINLLAVIKLSSVSESSMLFAAASVVLPKSNEVLGEAAIVISPAPAERLLCNKSFAAVRSISPPTLVTEFASVRL
jgi:hypothetical protein